jgi:hypothetical protein
VGAGLCGRVRLRLGGGVGSRMLISLPFCVLDADLPIMEGSGIYRIEDNSLDDMFLQFLCNDVHRLCR